MRHSKKNILLTLLVFSPLLLSGCQVVSVKNQKINVTIANERDSILTRSKMSEASLNVLSMTGREAKSCTEAPDRCIDELDEIKEIQDEQLFSTASEIYLTKALALASSSNCKISLVAKHKSEEKQKIIQKNYDDCQAQQLSMLDKSIRYSYAYLFKTERQPQDRIFNNRQVQIRDFYNQALAKFIALEVQNTKSPSVIKAGNSTYTFDFSHYPELEKNIPEALLSTYNMNFSGLRSINRRDGFGAEFVTILKEPTKAEEDKYIVDPVHHKYSNGMNPNIHKPRYLAVSITAQPEGNESVDSILHNPNFKLKIF